MKSLPETDLILYFLSCFQNFEKGKKQLGFSGRIETIDWNLFIHLALTHKVMPLIHHVMIRNNQVTIPGKIKTRITKLYRSNLMRNLAISSSMLKIINMLKTRHIACIPFKGPILAQFLYNDIALRQFSDIDLLISEKDALKTIQIFIDQGYYPEIDLQPHPFRPYVKHKNSIELKHIKSKLLVDLHWELTGDYSIEPFKFEYSAERILSQTFLNQSVPSLSKADLAACLFLHGTKNRWETLENIFAISILLKKFDPEDENMFLKICSKKRCKKISGLGLYLCFYLFDTKVPESLKTLIISYKNIEHMACQITNKLISHKNFKRDPDFRFSTFNLYIRDSFSDGVRYGIKILLQPGFVDWDRYNFPKYLTFLYFMIRPGRLAINYFKKLLNS